MIDGVGIIVVVMLRGVARCMRTAALGRSWFSEQVVKAELPPFLTP
jgi:hypothetical protein